MNPRLKNIIKGEANTVNTFRDGQNHIKVINKRKMEIQHLMIHWHHS